MDRLTDKEIIETARECCGDVNKYPNDIILFNVTPRMLEIINAQPTADIQEVVQAEWISVKDRLPEKSMDCLVCYDSGIIATRWFVVACNCWTRKPYQMVITHWMPLPKLPKEMGDNNG